MTICQWEDMRNSNDMLINTTDFQTAQALALKVQAAFRYEYK